MHDETDSKKTLLFSNLDDSEFNIKILIFT